MINDNIQQERLSSNSLLSKVFSHDKTKCIRNNPGLSVCINSNCTNKNPFVCSLEECRCVEEHDQCEQKRIKALIKQL